MSSFRRLIPLALLFAAPQPTLAHLVRGDSLWQVDPLVATLIALTGWLYLRGSRHQARRPLADPRAVRRRRQWFWAGWVGLIVALATPVDTLGEELFWVHMVQHETLMLIAAPLLVAARPTATLLRGMPFPLRRQFGRIASGTGVRPAWHWLVAPGPAWVLHAVVLWGWHAPSLFSASIVEPWIHTLQHISFLLIGLLFWWALALSDRRGSATGVIYLFTTAIHTAALGALLTFSERVWYTPYEATAPAWGLTALADQQLGGLIMWVPAGLVFIGAGLLSMLKVLRRREQRHEASDAQRSPSSETKLSID